MPHDPIEFLTRQLRTQLAGLPVATRYWVAYSGGMDSHSLLHAAAGLRGVLPGTLCAIHVDHGLTSAAGRWALHCAAVARELGVKFELRAVDARAPAGESPEAWARKQRYAALAELLGEDEVLLTAHHLDDQAETVLLQLLRGAGPHGLAAMAPLKHFAQGWLARPLLALSREQLHAYARAARLQWVDDQSNAELRFDRNVLRHEVLPRLRTHWPQAAKTLARAARWQASVARLVDEASEEALDACSRADSGTLSVAALNALRSARRPYVIRAWLRRHDLAPPSARHLDRILEDLLHPQVQGSPCVSWPGAQVRRYRDDLHALPGGYGPPEAAALSWRPPRPLRIDGGELSVVDACGRGLSQQACAGAGLVVRFRQGGERCRPAGRAHGQALKKLLQEAGVPPWRRSRMPLIYRGEELAAVGDLWVCAGFEAGPGQPGWMIRWCDLRGPQAT